MKVVINECYGGFGLSFEAFKWLIKNKNWVVTRFDENGKYINPKADLVEMDDGHHIVRNHSMQEFRTNPDLIECVETLGDKASDTFAELKIVEIPDDVKWEITEYDGLESVEECHRRWN
ncbi:MAG: hypothetical protein ACTSQ8_08085 [Candidatus Helarchaeota archaeon]